MLLCARSTSLKGALPESDQAVVSVHHDWMWLWTVWFILYALMSVQEFSLIKLHKENHSRANALTTSYDEIYDRLKVRIRGAECAQECDESRDSPPGPNCKHLCADLRHLSWAQARREFYCPTHDLPCGKLRRLMREKTVTEERLTAHYDRSAVALNLFNNFQSVIFYLLYTRIRRPEDRRLRWLPWLGVSLIAGLVHAAHLTFDWQFAPPDAYAWVGGIVAGSLLALLVSELDRSVPHGPRALVAILYVYAVIQSTWGLFESRPVLMLIMTTSALLMKTVLFFWIYWIIDSGALQYYLNTVILEKRQKSKLAVPVSTPRVG